MAISSRFTLPGFWHLALGYLRTSINTKIFKSTQTRAAEQSQEIASLKATKDVYDAQLAVFTNELLKTQVCILILIFVNIKSLTLYDELKEKQQQLLYAMISFQICKIFRIQTSIYNYFHNYQSALELERVETKFNQNLLIHDEVINEYTSQIGHEINAIKQFVRITHKRQENVKNTIKYMRNRLLENQTEMKQLKQTNMQLQNDVQIEQRQINSYRNQIETLNNEIHLSEKNEVIQTRIGDDQDNDRQNFIRQIIQEKDQYEQ
ncbi:unnamed protein product [Adineta steineri]|uniref:Uncharacterized protein n=1 Tax=Adineta steineri TaxID=433720 RepID=A0A819E523_9BILA|nr:unnamed protein product [Adineta steineri]CAF3844281.1 unnamed protein product [Adineta steineri]